MNTNFLNLNTMKTIKLFFISMLALAFVTSCSDDDDGPDPIIDQELITNVNVIFTPSNSANEVVTLSAVSADGIVAPNLNVTGDFVSGETYNATITITDEVNGENILEEIVEEKDEHFFVYSINSVDFTSMTRSANDEVRSDGESLGLNTTWVAGAAGSGSITVQLIHEPTSVSDDNGFGSASGGEFDVNNTWNVTID